MTFRILATLLKAIILFMLVASFVFSASVGFFIWKQPQVASDLISNLIPTPTHVPVKIKGIAVIGDSQSDEYQGDDRRGGTFYGNTFNWVELLAEHRGLNFGKWGKYEEPRRLGYEFNWARTGATAYSIIAGGQSAGVAEQVKKGKVNIVVFYIGANDFSPFITKDGYQQIYDGSITDANLTEKVNDVVANITTAVEIIKKSGDVQIIIIKVPDWGEHIAIKIAFPLPDRRARVTQAIDEVNHKLELLASQNNFIILDLDALYPRLVDNRLKVGSKKMELLLLNDDPRNIFLEDGVHTGTVFNGLVANEIIGILNGSFGAHIRPFSNKELVDNAGIID